MGVGHAHEGCSADCGAAGDGLGSLGELIAAVSLSDGTALAPQLRCGADDAFASWEASQAPASPSPEGEEELPPMRGDTILPSVSDTPMSLDFEPPSALPMPVAQPRLRVNLEPHRITSLDHLVNTIRPFNVSIEVEDGRGMGLVHAGMLVRAHLVFADNGEAVPLRAGELPLAGEVEKRLDPGVTRCVLRLRIVTNSYEHSRRLFRVQVHTDGPHALAGTSAPIRSVARLPNEKKKQVQSPPEMSAEILPGSPKIMSRSHLEQAATGLCPSHPAPPQKHSSVPRANWFTTYTVDNDDLMDPIMDTESSPESEETNADLCAAVATTTPWSATAQRLLPTRTSIETFIAQGALINELRMQGEMLQTALAEHKQIMGAMQALRSSSACK